MMQKIFDPTLCTEINRIITNKLVTIYFQPIVDLRTSEIYAYEALFSGPPHSPLHTHQMLIEASICCDLQGKLAEIGQDKILCAMQECKITQKVMLNSNLSLAGQKSCDHSFHSYHLCELMPLSTFGPQTTAEISPAATSDITITFPSTVRLSAQVMSSVPQATDEALAIPKYVIVNIAALRKHIPHKSPLAFPLEAWIKQAQTNGTVVIAEGIETSAELDEIMRLGINLGQGSLLAESNPIPPALTSSTQLLLAKTRQQTDSYKLLSEAFGITVGDIVQECPTVLGNTLVSKVESLFADEHLQGLVVLADHKPIGLMMKHRMYYHLGSHYGISLYYNRPISRVMDASPLIVSAELPLEAVAKMAMARKEAYLYDLIIVVKDQRYVGTVSVIHLLKHLTDLQLRSASNSNPLTGLAGNLLIEGQLKQVINTQLPFAVLYIDLDNFKAFNDKYGFEHGDNVLLFTATLLNNCLASYGSLETNNFLGHVGGDDFVIITHPNVANELGDAILNAFDKDIRRFYNCEDLSKGYIKVLNRKGKEEKFPIMTISIGIVHNTVRPFTNYLEIGEVAADLKKKAKKIEGSACVMDKRSDELK